jgi:hypothetical protein
MSSNAIMNVSNASFTNVSVSSLNVNGIPITSTYITIGTINNSNTSTVNISTVNVSVVNVSGNSIITQSASNTRNGIFISCGATMSYPSDAVFNTISLNNTSITSSGIISLNSSFINTSISSLYVTNVNGLPYGNISTNMSFINLSVNGDFSMPSTAIINVSNASFTNVSMSSLYVTNINGLPYGTGSANVSSNMSFINLSVNGNFSMPSTAIMNVSNASFNNLSSNNLYIKGQSYLGIGPSGPSSLLSIGTNATITTINGVQTYLGYNTTPTIASYTGIGSTSGNYNYIDFHCGGIGNNRDYDARIYCSTNGNTTTDGTGTIGFTAASVTSNSQITAPSFNATSDYNLKENISYLNKEFEINKLKPCTFNFKNSSSTQLGFIAQDVREIIPLSVSENASVLSINYSGIIAASVMTIKNLIERVENLESILKRNNII